MAFKNLEILVYFFKASIFILIVAVDTREKVLGGAFTREIKYII